MSAGAFIGEIVELIAEIPAPVKDAAFDLVKVVFRSLAAKDSFAETARKAEEALLSLKTAHAAMEARMQQTTPRYRP